MKGFSIDIEKETLANENFRKVLYTAHNSQLVVMCIQPHEDIGSETHTLDQFIRIEAGEGHSVLNGVERVIRDGDALVIPAGVEHNIINTSSEQPLKLYTVYSPPNHRDGVVHATKQDAEGDKEHFDGKTTES